MVTACPAKTTGTLEAKLMQALFSFARAGQALSSATSDGGKKSPLLKQKYEPAHR
jgi:hypothetical protein